MQVSIEINQLPPMSQILISALTQVADYFKVLSELSRLQGLCALKDGAKNGGGSKTWGLG
jgi:hypothetical protein